jgi:signal transduction histidine kinase/CheY-like chemotaxis protein
MRKKRKKTALAERRAALLQAAAKVGRSVTSILDPDRLLGQAVDIICDAFGFYYAGVFLIDETGEWAVLRAGRGEAGAAMIAEGHRLEVGGRSMIGTAIGQRRALIALDVGEEPVHFKNPHLPDTRSEMALPLIVGDEAIGALTVQSVVGAAFSEEDITALQAMADQLAIAINNARLLRDLEAAHAELVRTKTFEAIAAATTEAIHWIGNKVLPISTSVSRLLQDLESLTQTDPDLLESMREDLVLIEESARLILAVREHLIGPAREQKPRPAMLDDVVKDAAIALGIPPDAIHYTFAPDLPLGRADTTQLRRAFGYVFKNALEAMEGMVKQRITVEVAPTDDARFVAVRISDNGPGIPEEDLDNIWAAFYTTKGAGHAGLGLSATLRILKEIGGEVSASNTADGASFELLVPIFDGPLSPAELPTSRSVLLIDDDDAWGRFAGRVLEDAGNAVTRSADMRADPAAFDLILLDDVLEIADSEALLKWLTTLNAVDKTLVVASGLRVERAMQLMRLGARNVLLKPYTPAALAEMIS